MSVPALVARDRTGYLVCSAPNHSATEKTDFGTNKKYRDKRKQSTSHSASRKSLTGSKISVKKGSTFVLKHFRVLMLELDFHFFMDRHSNIID